MNVNPLSITEYKPALSIIKQRFYTPDTIQITTAVLKGNPLSINEYTRALCITIQRFYTPDTIQSTTVELKVKPLSITEYTRAPCIINNASKLPITHRKQMKY